MVLKAQIFVAWKVSATSHRLLRFCRYPSLQLSVILDICDLALHSGVLEDLILLGGYAGLGPVIRNGNPTAEIWRLQSSVQELLVAGLCVTLVIVKLE